MDAPTSRAREAWSATSSFVSSNVRAYLVSQTIESKRIRVEGVADRSSRASVEVYSIGHPLCPDFAEGGASVNARELDDGD